VSAYAKLIPEGKRACEALEKETRWPKEEWARSVRTLERAGLFPTIGLAQVLSVVRATGVSPDDIAHQLVAEAVKIKAAAPAPEKPTHQKTTVCSSRHAYLGPAEPHTCACRRLTGHAPVHECKQPGCGSVW